MSVFFFISIRFNEDFKNLGPHSGPTVYSKREYIRSTPGGLQLFYAASHIMFSKNTSKYMVFYT